MINKIDYLFIYKGDISKLPPLVTLLFLIKEKNENITLIIDQLDQELMSKFKNHGINIVELNIDRSLNNKIIQKLFYWWDFRKNTKKYLNQLKYKMLWFGSADTAISLYGLYDKVDFNINVYELYDKNKTYRFFLNKILPKAKKVVVPEETRASIFKVWYELKNKPIVLPNKPIVNPNSFHLTLTDEIKAIKDSKKKVILYQGIIVKGLRDLTPLCQAMAKLNEKWQLVLMGPQNPYIEELKKIYPELIYIPYIKPPLHLKVTELVDVCVVSYGYKDLNNIFCAPNKIWEYSMFGKPMLCNDVPCLKQTVENAKAGICVDMDDTGAIIKAIGTIEREYTEYSNNARIFYDSVDLEEVVDQLITGDKCE